jgi:hypothetical protein
MMMKSMMTSMAQRVSVLLWALALASSVVHLAHLFRRKLHRFPSQVASFETGQGRTHRATTQGKRVRVEELIIFHTIERCYHLIKSSSKITDVQSRLVVGGGVYVLL